MGEHKTTPKEEEEHCQRCGKVANPNDNWEFGWPLFGNIVLGHSSVIQWNLMRRIVEDSTNNEDELVKVVINGKHPAIKSFGYQKVEIEYGHDKDFRLCWDCHREFLEIVGEFFLKEPKPRKRKEPSE